MHYIPTLLTLQCESLGYISVVVHVLRWSIFSQQTIDLGWLYKAQGDEGTFLAWGMMGYHKDAEQLS